ncbi:MAG: M48 family metalloprotease [Proteobacteria bacterium]|jgi:beta-barrel assembly-enhancing protease|nr:M48 family metalloprotease [Pseudomonadota bacterium]
MNKRAHLVLLALLTLWCAPSRSAPALDQDEAGIWMVVEKQEQLLRTSPHRYKDQALESYLHRIVCDLRPDACDVTRVYVLDLPGLNAFMMPNGAMFIQTGLLLRMTTDSELASILAHELVHFTSKHSIENIRRWRKNSNAFAVIGAVVGAAGSVAAAGAATYGGAQSALNLSNSALYMLQSVQILSAFQLIAYQRDDEKESDTEGLRLINQAGFNPQAASTVWENYLAEESYAEDQRGFSVLSTHPMPETRRKYLKELATTQSQSGVRQDEDGFLEYVIPSVRLAWLANEVRALHPSQFEGLIRNQEKFSSTPKGYHMYSLGKSWELYSERQGVSRSKAKKARANAIDAYKEALVLESGMPKAGYRDLAKLAEQTQDYKTAVASLEKYLEVAPDAWDKKFVLKKLSKLKKVI